MFGWRARGCKLFWVAVRDRCRRSEVVFPATLLSQVRHVHACAWPLPVFCSVGVVRPGRKLFFPPLIDDLVAWSTTFRRVAVAGSIVDLSHMRVVGRVALSPTIWDMSRLVASWCGRQSTFSQGLSSHERRRALLKMESLCSDRECGSAGGMSLFAVVGVLVFALD